MNIAGGEIHRMSSEVEALIKAANEVLGKFLLEEDYYAGSVGAALRSSNGQIYTGICLDIACGIGFCAEHAAIAEMLKYRETVIESIVAVGPLGILSPCGRCRELMILINKRNADTKVILGCNRIVLLKDLLPEHWLSYKV